MGNLSAEDIREITEALGPIISQGVSSALDSYRKDYWVDPETHYQDHMILKNCRNNYDEMRRNHELITDLREGDKLESAVKFSNKLERREAFITKTVTKTTVVALVVGVISYSKEIFHFLISFIKHNPSP